MTTATQEDPAPVTRTTAHSHHGDHGDALHCVACAWLTGYAAAIADLAAWPVDDQAWRAAVRRTSDAIQAANARARADRPGPRDHDHPGGPVDWETGRVLARQP